MPSHNFHKLFHVILLSLPRKWYFLKESSLFCSASQSPKRTSKASSFAHYSYLRPSFRFMFVSSHFSVTSPQKHMNSEDVRLERVHLGCQVFVMVAMIISIIDLSTKRWV